MALTIHPIVIPGPWQSGWALDVHVVASDFIGYNQFGHAQYDSQRSEIGEELYQLKYRGNKAGLNSICETVCQFVQGKGLAFDLVVAVPPSNTGRPVQPLAEIAKGVAAGTQAQYSADAIMKVRSTPQLKGVSDASQRKKLLEDAFRASSEVLNGKRVLLLDDLYRSGATLAAVGGEILRNGHPQTLSVIALTRTGKRR